MRELSRMQYDLLACGDCSARGHQRRRGAGRRGRHHFSEHCRRDDRFEMGGRGGGRRREGGRGHGRFGGGRRISSEELQLLVLMLLSEQSLHGYQIIKELEERSKGFYKPSPGMIYPLLAYLEESELAEVTMDGSKKEFSLTKKGKEEISEKLDEAEVLFSWLKAQGELINAMEQAYAVEQRSAESPHRAKLKELRLLLKENQNAEHEAEINSILEEAIAKIKALL